MLPVGDVIACALSGAFYMHDAEVTVDGSGVQRWSEEGCSAFVLMDKESYNWRRLRTYYAFLKSLSKIFNSYLI